MAIGMWLGVLDGPGCENWFLVLNFETMRFSKKIFYVLFGLSNMNKSWKN
jgi:hypothetical protein